MFCCIHAALTDFHKLAIQGIASEKKIESMPLAKFCITIKNMRLLFLFIVLSVHCQFIQKFA
jgi:hypothetical protein